MLGLSVDKILCRVYIRVMENKATFNRVGQFGEFLQVNGISIGDLIEVNGTWGIVSCFSDDGTLLYYKPRGGGLFRGCAMVKDVVLG